VAFHTTRADLCVICAANAPQVGRVKRATFFLYFATPRIEVVVQPIAGVGVQRLRGDGAEVAVFNFAGSHVVGMVNFVPSSLFLRIFTQ